MELLGIEPISCPRPMSKLKATTSSVWHASSSVVRVPRSPVSVVRIVPSVSFREFTHQSPTKAYTADRELGGESGNMRGTKTDER